MQYKIIFLLIVAVFFAGCADLSSSGTTQEFIGFTSHVATGTTFTYAIVKVDSVGNIIPGTGYTQLDSIGETNLFHSGRSNVVHLYSYELNSGYRFPIADHFFTYDFNGDMIFQEYPDSIAANSWVTYGVQSRSSFSKVLYDTSIAQFGKYKSTETISFSGVESVPYKDTTIKCAKLFGVIENSVTNTPSGLNQLVHIEGYIYISPELGYIAKAKSERITGTDISHATGTQRILIDYHKQ